MCFKTISKLSACFLLPVLIALSSQADDFAEKGRQILKQNENAVVTVEVVIKLSAAGGRSRESKQDATGTVVDPSGLTVLSLSSCDPSEMYRRLYPDSNLDVEVSDLKILLEDGTELPAEIVLRDKDFDLAFVRPKTKPTIPMSAVDLSKSGSAQVLDQIITINRLNKAASRSYAASEERISAVVQKPRTFYIPSSTMTATTMGSPAFLPDGKVLGIFVIRMLNSSGGTADVRQNSTSIILPAEDVLKSSRQAPEAKGDADKKDESKGDTNAPADKVEK